ERVGQWIAVARGVHVPGLRQIGTTEGEAAEQGSETEEVGHRGNPFEGKVLSEYTAAMTTASLSSAVGYCSQRS
ncbi:hypothetical protein TI06_23785, partial [Vibrio vulnificus]